MSEVDTAVTRILADAHDPMNGYAWPHGTIHALCDEVDRLRARVVEVEAQRDALASTAARIFERWGEPDPLLEENDTLRARLAAVLDLHYESRGVCFHCYDVQGGDDANWPCPTVRAAAQAVSSPPLSAGRDETPEKPDPLTAPETTCRG